MLFAVKESQTFQQMCLTRDVQDSQGHIVVTRILQNTLCSTYTTLEVETVLITRSVKLS